MIIDYIVAVIVLICLCVFTSSMYEIYICSKSLEKISKRQREIFEEYVAASEALKESLSEELAELRKKVDKE